MDPTASTTSAGTPCGCPDFRLSRRRMLGTSLAAGGVLAAGQVFGDAFRQVAYGAEPGGNVVVVLSLRGGADGLSVVVPRGVDHDRLAAYRPGIVVPEGSLLGADPRFGLHPALAPLMGMWGAGTMGAVHAVGLPAPNRSHFAAMEQIEDADPGSAARVGWINRVTGLDTTAAPETAVSLGETLLPVSMLGPAAALGAYQVGDFAVADLGQSGAVRRRSISTMWGPSRTPLGQGVRLAVGAAQRFAPLVDQADTKVRTAAYPEGPLQTVLANTAALVREDLGTSMIAIDYGDWDMHEGLGAADGGWMHDHLTHFAASVSAFFADLGASASRVTVVTISEFGRRVEENGSGGVDHGYANAMLLLGAGVDGGSVRGAWPGLAQADLEDGDLALRHDFRDVLWEVVSSRFPAISGQRSTVFPGLAPSAPIGLMA
ncbi:DUF1501 domain-containing protein [Nocardioides rubriscoriae]|uniref:DUF1501 domain-containing protein n=1 Tax=Nocardioides rubriscoriae TaxID=642762 RepID=UPI0011E03934|nr:DUF1501 domain-containing protein [Nocardioides rubriscoriae]